MGTTIGARFVAYAGGSILLLTSLAIAGCGGGDTSTMDSGPPPRDARVIDAPPECDADDDCDDGLFCNGTETCAEGQCVAGSVMQCDDGIECTRDRCDEDRARCTSTPPDADADGDPDRACLDADGTPFGGDCDDADPARFSGNTELCDAANVDEDCDPTTIGERDFDGDGVISADCCNGDTCGVDCNDSLRSVNPDGTEICNTIDDNCDGNIDEDVRVAGFFDADGDGRGNPDMPMTACGTQSRFSVYGDDCDDTNVARSPTLPEACDGIDNDCDGTVDDSPVASNWYEDRDGDGFGDPGRSTLSCAPPMGSYSLLGTDCNDAAPGINPAQAERCNAVDDDCNGSADYVIGSGDLEDDDLDGNPDVSCTPPGGDCDDRDPASGPGTPESCDGRDNDCDGEIDELVLSFAYFRDLDGDGWGNSSEGFAVGCVPATGLVRRGGDCDDTSAMRYPGADETCDGLDQDCDSAVDETPASAMCPRMGGQEQTCVAGFCRPVGCAPGFADCDANEVNGCETDLATTLTSCGMCGRRCVGGANTTAACVGGACVVPACRAGFMDCDGDLLEGGNGCETSISDPANCGMCGRTCIPEPGTSSMCVMGACSTPVCAAGRLDCNGDLGTGGNGCESVDTSTTSCGMCGNSCVAEPGVVSACSAGACTMPACVAGYLDCNGDLGTGGNGCEVFSFGDVDNCGMCGRQCPREPNAVGACTAGTCGALACRPGYSDCNRDLGTGGNGCETAAPACSRVAWGRTWGDVGDDRATGNGTDFDVTADAFGNVYVAGAYGTDITVNGTVYPAARFGGVIVSYSGTGAFRWAQGTRASTSGDLVPRRVLTDPTTGDVFVALTGWGSQAIIAGTDVGVQGGNCSAVIARLSSATGAVLWGRTYNTTGTQCAGLNGLALSSSGTELIAAGRFNDTLTLAPTTAAPINLVSAGASDGFIARIDPVTGLVLSAFRFGGGGNEEATSVAVRGTDVLVGGLYHTGSADIGGTILPNDGSLDGFFARFTSAGALVHAGRVAGVQQDQVLDVRNGPGPYWYISGLYDGATTVGTTPLSGSSFGTFLAAVDSVGSNPWVIGQSGGGNALFGMRRFAVDASGTIHAAWTGGSSMTTTFGGVPFRTPTFGADAYIAYVNGTTGAVTRLEALDGPGADFYGHAIGLLPDGRNVIAGNFSSSITVEGWPYGSAGGWDAHVTVTSF